MFEPPKEDWVDSVEGGTIKCEHCSYCTNSRDFLEKHNTYHKDDREFILYMECKGSLKGRNTLIDNISAQEIDCTGGQAAFEDGDINVFGQELVNASRKTKFKIYRALRMHDPGLGLCFPEWWIDAGIKAGVFEKYSLPQDVLVKSSIN
jgi:hypothetical protein